MQVLTLQAKNIYKNFVQNGQVFEVLKDISYSFEQNKTYAITGVSGTGKSTFIHILAGIEVPTKGHVFNSLDADSVGIVFQEPFLIKELSVVENIMIKGLIKNENYKDCHERAIGFLKKIGLESKANKSPAILSGGQKQRVAILRAIFNAPKFLLADEPTGNLDEKTATEIVDFLLQCAQEWNMGLIVSTHDINLQSRMDITLKIENGVLK
ncbi:MAG: ATP-binding cassette domain-containing protein [Candidatus Babeliales bacterium]|nr:ATP-binding cassette domain-containing protein [Candidatus Babeliales bacterium]